jgi:hypothetical protein
VVTLTRWRDYEALLGLKSIPVVMRRGEIYLSDPFDVYHALPYLERLNRVISLHNPIYKGHPMYEQEYVQYLSVAPFKGKEARTEQVLNRLDRRIYIDGYLPEDLDIRRDVVSQLSEIKRDLVNFFEQYGELEAVFAKCKEE